MKTIDLGGAWELECLNPEKTIRIPADVPGCVHTDLIRENQIEDPYYRDNEFSLQWIGESEWIYRREFEVDAEMLDFEQLELECDGLDTFATVVLNGIEVGWTNNMFISHRWDVKALLHPGTNSLSVRFDSSVLYGRECQKEHFLKHAGQNRFSVDGGHWTRKQACNFGWDWGPMLVTAGIWRPMRVRAWNTAKLGECQYIADVLENGSGKLRVECEVLGDASTGTISVAVYQNGNQVAEVVQDGIDSRPSIVLDIPDVEIWWPNGMGAQPLYEVRILLQNESNQILDLNSKRIGFRSLELVTDFDEWGQSFKFRANGVDFFAKGANWIPADVFDIRTTEEHLRDLLQSCVDANMNMLRVWGGANYERDRFYELCDELGICIWQDFMFACAAYPLHEPDFMDNIRYEAEQNVKRIRHHACLALWCGNNELEHMDGYIGDEAGAMRWDHYSRWFDVELREIVKQHDPQTAYWPASEHSPIGNRTPREFSSDPRWGDAHLWRVWHGREPFEWYRGSLHRFCSEFGFQSFPHPETIESFTIEDDRSITSRIMELHQRSPGGNANIMHYLMEWFRLPTDFENGIWLSQILQCMGIKYAVEHWRRNMPRCMGATYWQLNDCWPVASWASIDYNRRWKALHYDAKRFFARDLVSVIEHPETRTLELHLTSDNLEVREAEVIVKCWNTQTAELLDTNKYVASTPVNGARQVAVYEPNETVKQADVYDLIFQVELIIDGGVVSENMATLVRPKHLNLRNPEVEVKHDVETGEIAVQSNYPAMWIWFMDESDANIRFSDNFFHLFPGQRKSIQVVSDYGHGGEMVSQSLWNTYQ